MKLLKIVSLFMLGAFVAPVALGQEEEETVTKIGTADLSVLVGSYHKVKVLREKFAEYGKGIREQEMEKVEVMKKLQEEIAELKKEAVNENLPREKKKELMDAEASKFRELRNLAQARQEWVKRKSAALQEQFNVDIGELRKEIVEMVKEVGKAEGYDYIFDKSATSGANVVLLSYAKDATDLTAKLLERINRDAPPEEEE